nr:DUF3331 domain-containing protein [Burkholderia sp. MSMB1078WGS]
MSPAVGCCRGTLRACRSSVLERPTGDTGNDFLARRMHRPFGYQKWRLFTTRKRSVCALLGRTTEIGDSVDASQLLGSTPGNAVAMILAISLRGGSRSIGPQTAAMEAESCTLNLMHTNLEISLRQPINQEKG